MRTEFQSTSFILGGPSSREAANGTMRTHLGSGLAEARPATGAEASSFDEWLSRSGTTGETRAQSVLSLTENTAGTDRVVQNFSPLSESPSSVARAIRESYGRYLSARPRRFHAHA
jgi:hypothetical protein